MGRLIFLGLLLSFATSAQARPGSITADFDVDETVTCSSRDYEFRKCYVGGGISSASLIEYRSDRSCMYGRTWGYTSQYIWVNDGCRATVAVSLRGRDRDDDGGWDRDPRDGDRWDRNPRDRDRDGWDRDRDGWDRDRGDRNRGDLDPLRSRTTCESVNGRYKSCGSVIPISRVRLIEQRRSSAACVLGVSWGYDHRRIWVDRGCRAVFELTHR